MLISQHSSPTNLACYSLRSPPSDRSNRKDRIFTTNCTTKGINNGAIGAANAKAKAPPKWAQYGGCISSIMHALNVIADLDEAMKPWEGSLGNKERTIILKEQVNCERALEIFEWFKKKGCYELNVIHYNIMLRVLGKSRRWNSVERLWLEMQGSGITPTNSTYGTLIDVFSKGGLRREALVWLGVMLKQGLEPDEVTIGTVIQTYKKAHEFGEAQQLFRKWSLVRSNDLGPKCYNLHIYNTLIDMHGKAGQLKEASEMFAEMLKLGVAPNTITFNIMIHVCGNHGQLEEVASLMAKMEELRCLPDTRTYNILISLYAKCDDISRAVWYFSEMKKSGLVPDIVSYRTLLYAYSIRLMVREAESLALEMDEQGFQMDEFTQSALTRMYIEVGMPEKSWSWFEKFQDVMTSECYAANIDAFGEHGHFSYAEKAFFKCLTRRILSVSVFNVMIKAYGLSKNYEKVCDTVDGMETYGVFPDKCTFNSVVQILSGADMPHKAVLYARKMRLAGLLDDCIPYCAVISSFARLGELGLAEDLFREMVASEIEPDIVVFGVLINAFSEAGNVSEAKKYVNLMNTAGFSTNSVICNTLIKLYTKVGFLQEAQETYKTAQMLEDGPDMYSSNCMIELYAENNMVIEAERVFKYLQRRGEAGEFSYAMMLCLYKKVGRLNEGFAIAQEMLNRSLLTDALSYSVVIELFAVNGRLKDAARIFQQMLNSGVEPNDATFRSLGISLIKRGVPKEAVNHLESARKKNNKNGLLAWIETLQSMLGFDDHVLKLERKLKTLPQT